MQICIHMKLFYIRQICWKYWPGSIEIAIEWSLKWVMKMVLSVSRMSAFKACPHERTKFDNISSRNHLYELFATELTLLPSRWTGKKTPVCNLWLMGLHGNSCVPLQCAKSSSHTQCVAELFCCLFTRTCTLCYPHTSQCHSVPSEEKL